MTDPTTDCLFCRILRGEIPAKKVYENEHVFAFEDINPKAPTHVLIIPRKHFAGLKEAQAEDAEVIGRCHLAAAEIARQRNIEQGYRTVLNVGPGAGQSVFHLRPSPGRGISELAPEIGESSGQWPVVSFEFWSLGLGRRRFCSARRIRIRARLGVPDVGCLCYTPSGAGG